MSRQRRLFHRLARVGLDATAVLSLLACVALVVLWVRDGWVVDGVEWEQIRVGDGVWAKRSAEVLAGKGGVKVGWSKITQPAGPEDQALPGRFTWRTHDPRSVAILRPKGAWQRLGFGANAGTLTAEAIIKGYRESFWTVRAPFWFLVAVASALPAWRSRGWGRAVRGRRRSARGLCGGCGYDLRATSNRCPECGTPLAARSGGLG